ncbi:hypothetical protein LG293_17095 (plasmid) [Citricoccus nitrophenolicus]
MSETDGGLGTHQHQTKGHSVGKDNGRSIRRPDAPAVQPPTTFLAIPATEVKLAALPREKVDGLAAGGTGRSLARYVAMRDQFTFSAAHLEGNTFTLPEVRTLLGGTVPEGKQEDEIQQILDLTEASESLIAMVGNDSFRLDLETSDRLHGIIARNEALVAGRRRPYTGINLDGHGASVSVMGDRFEGYPHDQLIELETVLMERISAINHPVDRALNYAAFASYAQMYLDGNKRTARYMMDGELMRHGYDAVAIPASLQREFNRSLAAMFRTGDLTPYATFLLGVLSDGTDQ